MSLEQTLRVFVRGLAIEAEIGLHPHERGAAQPLVIDLELTLAAGEVRRIGDTVDYDRLVARTRDLAGRGHIDLVETFAQDLAAACLEEPRARAVRVRIEKPQAVSGAFAGVEVVASKGG